MVYISRWLGIGLVIAGLLMVMRPVPVLAGKIDSIRVPDSIPSVPYNDPTPNIIDPEPLIGSWAVTEQRPLGITLSNYDLTIEQIEAAQHTGCKVVRLTIPMEHFLEEVEPDWAVLDQVISRLTRADFEILPVLDAKSAIPEFYAGFCSTIASRYAQTFTYYQLLDNVNYKIGLTSRVYTDVVALARRSILEADPDALIVSGGIRGVDITYLEMLANQGAMRSFDVLAFNLYPAEDGIQGIQQGNRPEHSLPYMEQAVEWAKSHGKRVWVTSLGVSTCYSLNGVDQATQASMYARGILNLGLMGVERIIFSSIQDTDPTYSIPAGCCGLLDVMGAPKASFYALQSLIYAIEGGYHVSPPTSYEGFVYQRPAADELFSSSSMSDIYTELGISPDELSIGPFSSISALSQYRVYNLEVYAFWFYKPDVQEYVMIYWHSGAATTRTVLSLSFSHVGLTPVERYILLDNAPSPVDSMRAQNFVALPMLPLETLPGVIRFEVNADGRSG